MGLGIARRSPAVGSSKPKRTVASGSGVIKERETSGHRVAAVQGDDRADFPSSYHCIGNTVHVRTHLLSVTERKLVVGVGREDVGLIEVARPPLRLAIVDVLPERSRQAGLRAAPSATEVAGRVRHTLRVGVSNLTLQSVGESLLQCCLQRIVGLIGAREGGQSSRQTGEGARASRDLIPESRISGKERSGRPSAEYGRSRRRRLRAGTWSCQNPLSNDFWHDQVSATLAYVSNLEGRFVGQLLLHRQVPLLHIGRPEIRIPGKDSYPVVTGEIGSATKRRRRSKP